MKKNVKKLLCVLFSIMFAIPFTLIASAAEDLGVALTDEDFLVTKGRDLVNQKGEKVVLQGVNLGSWLVQEDWLSPYEEADDHYSIFTTLTERFGVDGAYALLNTYEENWITEYDFDCIKEMGFNCVRLPFWYRNFYSDDVGTKILDENGEWDFSKLDFVVEECGKRGLYVILDLHGAPGFQSDAEHTGKNDSCQLFDDTEQGEFYRTLTDELWSAIATRFRGNPAVAMYDLLNEPGCEVPGTEINRRINNTEIYSRLYNTVRAVDPEHVITLECIWTAIALPLAPLKGWTNVVYQVHFYNNSDFIFAVFLLFTRIIYCTVPMMMGEFYPLERTTWEGCFNTMNKLGFSWMLWTYKGAGHGMWESDWVLKGSRNGFERAKLQSDSYEEIARKWGDCIRTENGYVDSGHYNTVMPFITCNN